MNDSHTTSERLVELGGQIRAQRLRLNLTLEEVAMNAGLSINVVRRLESGEGSTLASFVSVLRVLRRDEWLTTLQPAVTIDPLSMLKKHAPRQRAYKPRKPKPD